MTWAMLCGALYTFVPTENAEDSIVSNFEVDDSGSLMAYLMPSIRLFWSIFFFLVDLVHVFLFLILRKCEPCKSKPEPLHRF